MEDVECSLRARLSASRSSGSPARFLEDEEPREDLTRDHESNDISDGRNVSFGVGEQAGGEETYPS